MDNVEKIYNDGKLLVRAMDQPIVRTKIEGKCYDCTTWIDEFSYLLKDGLNSLSTTLIVPGVGVKNYKNIGFLIDSSLADCFHIAKSDSGSCGSIIDGDFHANKPDYNSISELATYIKQNDATVMNEVNVNVKLDAVVGLFINKCTMSYQLLKKIYVVEKLLEYMTGIEYPIYLYDWNNGKLDRIDMTLEQEEEIINSLDCNQIFYWPEDNSESEIIPITHKGLQK